MKITKSGIIHLAYGVRGPLWAAGYHTGTDFEANVGTPLYAAKGGKVVFAGYHNGWGASYGNHIIIEFSLNGHTRRAAYCHMSRFAVGYGQVIKDGQYLGLSGESGHVTGPHCHYEERVSPYGYYNNAAPVALAYQPGPTIVLSKLKPGKVNWQVWKLKQRLNKYFPKKRPLIGFVFTKELRNRYAEYQKNLGYKGSEANGIPGTSSLQKLGFQVI